MYYVYRIRSRHYPKETYVGMTRSVDKRLALHNAGEIKETRDFSPWRVSFYAAFSRKKRAEAFLDFLSTPEGTTFARRHLWQQVEDMDAR